MESTKTYVCPNCKGALIFDTVNQTLKCQYCFSSYSQEELDVLLEKERQENLFKETNDSVENDSNNMDSYRCSSCGAEILADENTTATFCIYCKSPTIIKGKFTGKFKPKSLIPFKIDKNSVKEMYSKWIKKRIFAPNEFKSKEEIDKITGLYVPFWIFDIDTMGSIQALCTSNRYWSDKNYDYTEISSFDVWREGAASYSKIPIDGLKELDNSSVRQIEPYDYNDLVDFSMMYMPGFLAESFDVEESEAEIEAKGRAEGFISDDLEKTMSGYSTTIEQNRNITTTIREQSYTLFPVYILTNEHKGKNYTFLLNGQTGKISGTTPIDKYKVVKFFLKVTGILLPIVALGGALVLYV